MFDLLDTLVALSQEKTMQKAAIRLKTTQPTVSKRIAALELEVGRKLVEPKGRRVELTPFGKSLALKVNLQLSQIKDLLKDASPLEEPELHLGISESVLLGHHNELTKCIQESAHSGINVVIHSLRSPLVHQEVSSGKYDLGIVTGDIGLSPTQMKSYVLFQEEFCLVSNSRVLEPDWDKHLVTIESHSSTWQEVEQTLIRRSKKWKLEPKFKLRTESFASATVLAMDGFGAGLVPQAVAKRLRQRGTYLHPLPKPGLSRRVCLIARKSALKRTSVLKLWHLLKGSNL